MVVVLDKIGISGGVTFFGMFAHAIGAIASLQTFSSWTKELKGARAAFWIVSRLTSLHAYLSD